MSNTGRYFVKKGGRTFVVEPIDNTQGKGRRVWGDIDPATKSVNRGYGDKAVGAIHEDDSMITEDKFKNIKTVKGSPMSYIDQLLKQD